MFSIQKSTDVGLNLKSFTPEHVTGALALCIQYLQDFVAEYICGALGVNKHQEGGLSIGIIDYFIQYYHIVECNRQLFRVETTVTTSLI